MSATSPKGIENFLTAAEYNSARDDSTSMSGDGQGQSFTPDETGYGAVRSAERAETALKKQPCLVFCKAASRKRLPTHLRERDVHRVRLALGHADPACRGF
ncbi:MAG: hypothetical protein WB689_36265 [Xanthobacteraceae bacterium]